MSSSTSSPTVKSPAVIAVVATFRRALELRRLLTSLEDQKPELRAVVVVDNANDEETAAVLRSSSLDCRRVVPGRNLGCGGGLAEAERVATEIFATEYTHLWILDDDAVVPSGTLACLLQTMAERQAWAAVPLVTDAEGRIGWFPGLADRQKFTVLKARPKVDDYRNQAGAGPTAFTWCTGVSLLVTRAAIERLGFHRDDYWIRGEDLEFGLRLSSHGLGILVPEAVVQHLPRPATGTQDGEEERLKHLAMLRNLAYTGTRLPHGRTLLRTLPGNLWRFLRTWGSTWKNFTGIAESLWQGAILGLPAGVNRTRD